MNDEIQVMSPTGMKKPAKAAPSLPKGNDAAVAEQLRHLVTDAEDGLRRILIAGFFIDRIAAELPHGQLGRWLEAHCPEVTHQTINRWRGLAKNVAEACQLKLNTRVQFDLPALLAMPVDEVPELLRHRGVVALG